MTHSGQGGEPRVHEGVVLPASGEPWGEAEEQQPAVQWPAAQQGSGPEQGYEQMPVPESDAEATQMLPPVQAPPAGGGLGQPEGGLGQASGGLGQAPVQPLMEPAQPPVEPGLPPVEPGLPPQSPHPHLQAEPQVPHPHMPAEPQSPHPHLQAEPPTPHPHLAPPPQQMPQQPMPPAQEMPRPTQQPMPPPPAAPGLPPLPPEPDSEATQYIAPVAGSEETQYIPPVPGSEATQYIPPVASYDPPPAPAAPEARGAHAAPAPPDAFEALYRDAAPAPQDTGATQQMPRIPGGQAPQGPPPPYGPGPAQPAHHGNGGYDDYDPYDYDDGPARSGIPRWALVALVTAVCVVVGLTAGWLLSSGGGDSEANASDKKSSAPAADDDEPAKKAADPAKTQAAALDKLLAASNDSRAAVIRSVANIRACKALGKAATDLRAAAKQRNDLVTRLAETKTDKIPDNVALVAALNKGWKASASADNHYALWAGQMSKGKACKHGGQARATNQLRAGNTASGQATTAKRQAADLWKPTAAKYGLPPRAPEQL
ncbi:hypothetical protein [Streptomyces boninensis]|uniref:hypothetical protein n=1 Tax=Streptomyces boninensis TaxID=2039455 RepID=UPI003B2204B2